MRFWQRYATDPEWKDFFRNRKRILASLASKYGVSEKEQKKEKLIPYWHTPSKLMEQRTKSKSFLRWLYKWFYQDTSEQAHLSNSGIFVVAPFLLADVVGGEDQEITETYAIKQYHYLHVSRTCIVTLAIATEISTFFNLDNNSQLAYLWTMFSEHVPEAKDMYEQRYRGLLH